jgi:hypothetical protein
MSTKLWLETRDEKPRRLTLTLSFPGAVAADCSEPCPCGSSSVVGDGIERSTAHRDRYIAKGFCAGCRARRGIIYAEVSTLFGVEEDERVLAGPWKVY